MTMRKLALFTKQSSNKMGPLALMMVLATALPAALARAQNVKSAIAESIPPLTLVTGVYRFGASFRKPDLTFEDLKRLKDRGGKVLYLYDPQIERTLNQFVPHQYSKFIESKKKLSRAYLLYTELPDEYLDYDDLKRAKLKLKYDEAKRTLELAESRLFAAIQSRLEDPPTAGPMMAELEGIITRERSNAIQRRYTGAALILVGVYTFYQLIGTESP